MSKFVRILKNMSKVQKMIALGVSSVVVCGAVGGGILWYNHYSVEAENEKIISEAEDMSSDEVSDFLSNNAVDEDTRKELEEKLDEKYSEEDPTIATKPTEEDKEEETKPSDDSNKEDEVSKPADKPSTGGSGSTDNSKPADKPVDKPSTGGGSGSTNNQKPTEPSKPVDPPKPSRPSGYSSSVTNEFWAQIDKGMVNNTSEDAENLPRIHKELKAKLDNITSGYVNRTKSASQTKNEIMNIGWTPAWSFDSSLMSRPKDCSVTTISVSGDLSAKQAGLEIYKKWTNGTWEIPYNYVNCKVYYESSNNTYIAYLVGSVDKFNK